jgi:nitrogen PTS system EIIA component
MKILDALRPESILLDLQSKEKVGVIRELARPIANSFRIDYEKLVQVLMERERLGSTGIGGGIGIPHGKLKELKELVLGFGLSRKGVDFDSMDTRPTYIFFLLLTPDNSTGLHLKALARISRILKNEVFKQKLLTARVPEDVIIAIGEEDEDF